MPWPLADSVNDVAEHLFGEPISYARRLARDTWITQAADRADGTTLTGIFDAAYQSIDMRGDGTSAASVGPKVDIRKAALSFEPVRDDKVSIAGVRYSVNRVHDDGRNAWQLFLTQIG